MRKTLIILGLFCLFLGGWAAEPETSPYTCSWNKDLNVNLEDDFLIFTATDFHEETVKMNAEGRLWVNGREVPLRATEKKMVADYYEMMSAVIYEATEVGLEGAKVGLHGARLALSALAEVLEAAVTEKEMKEAEAAIEKKSREIEKKAAKIEKRAEKLEALAERLEKNTMS